MNNKVHFKEDSIWNMNKKKPNISYFHSFGYKCFIHNNGRDNLCKFDPRNDEGIFLGYSNTCRVCWIFNKHTSTVEESTYVMFDESNPIFKIKWSSDDEDFINSVVIALKEVNKDQLTTIYESQQVIESVPNQ